MNVTNLEKRPRKPMVSVDKTVNLHVLSYLFDPLLLPGSAGLKFRHLHCERHRLQVWLFFRPCCLGLPRFRNYHWIHNSTVLKRKTLKFETKLKRKVKHARRTISIGKTFLFINLVQLSRNFLIANKNTWTKHAGEGVVVCRSSRLRWEPKNSSSSSTAHSIMCYWKGSRYEIDIKLSKVTKVKNLSTVKFTKIVKQTFTLQSMGSPQSATEKTAT